MDKEKLFNELRSAFENMPKTRKKLVLYANDKTYRELLESGYIRIRSSDGSEYCYGAEVIRAPFIDDGTMFVLTREKDIQFPKVNIAAS